MGDRGQPAHLATLLWSRTSVRCLVILHDQFDHEEFSHPHSHGSGVQYGRESCAAAKFASEAQGVGIRTHITSMAL